MDKNVIEMIEKTNEQVVEKINSLLKDGIKQTNVDYLYKLVDIHKDLANEEYWDKMKEEDDMRYRGYSGENYNEGGSYGRRRRDSRGRYMEGGNYNEGGRGGNYGEYGRRGNYRGHEMIDEMQEHYGNYSEGYFIYALYYLSILLYEFAVETNPKWFCRVILVCLIVSLCFLLSNALVVVIGRREKEIFAF